MAISKELPGVTEKSTSCSTVPLKAPVLVPNRVHAGAIYELLTLAEGIPTDPANRTRFGYVIGCNANRYVFYC